MKGLLPPLSPLDIGIIKCIRGLRLKSFLIVFQVNEVPVQNGIDGTVTTITQGVGELQFEEEEEEEQFYMKDLPKHACS